MSAKKVVLVTGTAMVPDKACSYIESRGYVVRRANQDNFTAEELHQALAGASGYLIGGYEEPRADHFEQATQLEAAAWVGTDYKAYVPGWKRAYELGIAFINSPGTNAISVAEFTVLLALSMARPFTSRIISSTSGNLDIARPGQDLYARQIGVIGLGRIGARVARIASLGFGMSAMYHAPRRNEALEQSLGVRYMTKDDLIQTSDVIALHRPGPAVGELPELGRHEFELMKEGAILVNTAHHQLVDLGSLLWACEKKDVRAAFDGTGSGSSWDKLVALGADRFLTIPSMAFNTTDANLRASMRTAEAVCDVLDGDTSDAVNNPEFRELRQP